MSESSTVFDAGARLKSVEIAIGDRVHRGRILSIIEWFAFAERFDAQIKREAGATAAEAREAVLAAHALMLEFLRAVFPPRRSWRAWFRRVDPVAVVEAHGLAAVTETFHLLFEHQAAAQGMVPRRLNTPTPTTTPTPPNGTASPDKPAEGPSADSSGSATS